jgi:hypothetical protein
VFRLISCFGRTKQFHYFRYALWPFGGVTRIEGINKFSDMDISLPTSISLIRFDKSIYRKVLSSSIPISTESTSRYRWTNELSFHIKLNDHCIYEFYVGTELLASYHGVSR